MFPQSYNNTIISTDEDPSLRIESSAIINLRGVFTKLNKYKEIDIGKVGRLLNQINTKKSPGLDSLPDNLLKIAAGILAPSLTKIFDKSLSTGIYPNDWKLGVVSIFKCGDRSDMNNYRPISIILRVVI